MIVPRSPSDLDVCLRHTSQSLAFPQVSASIKHLLSSNSTGWSPPRKGKSCPITCLGRRLGALPVAIKVKQVGISIPVVSSGHLLSILGERDWCVCVWEVGWDSFIFTYLNGFLWMLPPARPPCHAQIPFPFP